MTQTLPATLFPLERILTMTTVPVENPQPQYRHEGVHASYSLVNFGPFAEVDENAGIEYESPVEKFASEVPEGTAWVIGYQTRRTKDTVYMSGTALIPIK